MQAAPACGVPWALMIDCGARHGWPVRMPIHAELLNSSRVILYRLRLPVAYHKRSPLTVVSGTVVRSPVHAELLKF